MAPVLIGFKRIWRYYQAGVVNTLFGYGLYALFIAVGFNMYISQITAHIMGAIFNYFTYSIHTFQDLSGSKIRFAVSYFVNYLMGLASLYIVYIVIKSPYTAGLIAVLFVSIVNYFILKCLVFTEPARR